VVLLVLSLVLLASLYEAPAATGTPPANATPDRGTCSAVILAGFLWGLYNTSFAMIFSFGPSMLAERGLPLTATGSITSIMLWLALVSVPLGGFLTDRTLRPYAILVAGCLASALLMLLATRAEAIPVFVALGIVSGLPVGAIMSLPARVLAPNTRAIGMGVFYTVFYACMGLGPPVGGRLATWSGSASAAFDFGAALLAACPLILWPFHRQAMATSHDPASVATHGRA
jgi:MFS family permease